MSETTRQDENDKGQSTPQDDMRAARSAVEEEVLKATRSANEEVLTDDPAEFSGDEQTELAGEEPGDFSGEGHDEETPEESTLKVDGEEVTVPHSDIKDRLGVETVTDEDVTEYQKHLAADKRFTELGRKEAELKAREEALKQATAKEESVHDDSGLIAEFTDAILLEDHEAAKRIFQKMTSSQKEGVTPEQIAAITRQEIERARVQTDIQNAVSKFEEKFPHLDANPILKNAVDQESIRIHHAEPNLTPWQVVKKAAKNVEKATGNTPSKRTSSVGGISRAASFNKKEPPPLTASDKINAEIARRTANLS